MNLLRGIELFEMLNGQHFQRTNRIDYLVRRFCPVGQELQQNPQLKDGFEEKYIRLHIVDKSGTLAWICPTPKVFSSCELAWFSH